MNNYLEFREKIREELKKIKDEEMENLIKRLQKDAYYMEKNLNKYLEYKRIMGSIKISEVIKDVNTHRDKQFYSESKMTDISKGELMLVNKYYYLLDSYKPDLVLMADIYAKGVNKYLEKNTYRWFQKMVEDAKKENIILYSVSGFRSYEYQKELYDNYVLKDGIKVADTYSARAGYSEHQTGYALDINTASSLDHFEDTKEFLWLSRNAHKYGFILRYPKDKENITGFKFEPWHYRYVGIEVATYIKKHNLTFEEYYEYFVENK